MDRGIEVNIFAGGPGKDRIVHEDVERYDLLARTYYFCDGQSKQSMSSNKFKRAIKAPLLLMKNIHKNPMALLNSMNFIKYGKYAASLSLLYSTAAVLNDDDYDIIHCHFGTNGNVAAYLKDIGATTAKVITTFHGYDITKSLKNNNGNSPYNLLSQKGDMFLPISKRWEDELIKLGFSKEKIVVHRMGVDINKFKFAPRRLEEDRKINLLSVARLVEKKGLQYAIQAVAKVLKKYPDIEYKIVGNGPLKEDLEKMISNLLIGEKVKLLGNKRQEEIIELMQETDIVLAPSVTSENGDQEGVPIVLMEALAQGLPVISTYHSGIPELVHDGKSGFLVREKDIDDISDKLTHLIEHAYRWPEMGQSGRKFIEDHYAIDKLNDQLLEIYKQLL